MATEISTAEQFYNIRNDLTGSYVLTADIDLSGYASWSPIGTGNGIYSFTGTLDGANHNITGLTINDQWGSSKGIFGRCTGATFKDFTISNATVVGYMYVGALCGYIAPSATASANMSNVHITDCQVTGYSSVGALMGYGSCNLTNCTSSGTITSNGTQDHGGLIGTFRGNTFEAVTISQCSSSCTVNGIQTCGGLIGSASIQNPTTGYKNVTIQKCYATGNVTATSSGRVGGLIGMLQFGDAVNAFTTVENCSASGNAHSTYTGATAVMIGGLIGAVSLVSKCIITNCYSCGHVQAAGTGSVYIGGHIGDKDADATVTGCYYDSQTSGRSDNDGRGIPITTVQAKTLGTYSGWDFTTVWGLDGDYPYLLWVAPVVPYPHLKWEHAMPALIQPNFNINTKPDIQDTDYHYKYKITATKPEQEFVNWNTFNSVPVGIDIDGFSLTNHQVYSGGAVSSSAAMCKDGRVIYVFKDPNSSAAVRQGYSPSYQSFVSTTNSVTNVSIIPLPTDYNRAAVVFNIGTDLYMSVFLRYSNTSTTNVVTTGYYLYKSDSGNGDDWHKHADIHTFNHPSNALTYGVSNPSAPFRLPSGRLVICGPRAGNNGTSYDPTITTSAWYSDNNGDTWTNSDLNVSIWYGIGQEANSRNIGYFNGALYCSASGLVGGGSVKLYKSVDNGAHWTYLYNGWSVWPYTLRPSYFDGGDGYFYMAAIRESTSTPMQVYRTATPDVAGSWGAAVYNQVTSTSDLQLSILNGNSFIIYGSNSSGSIDLRPYPHLQFEDTIPTLIPIQAIKNINPIPLDTMETKVPKLKIKFSESTVTYIGWQDNIPVGLSGTGTEQDPYQVATAADLDAVRNNLSAYYIQTADIDLSGYANWTPIGGATPYFTGSYDGQNYTISNLTIDGSSELAYGYYNGLFGRVANGSSLKNIHIRDASMLCGSYTGVLAGSANATTSCTVENCSATGTMDAKGDYFGGLIGITNNATITNCWANVSITDTLGDGELCTELGGLLGDAGHSTISESFAIAHIHGKQGADYYNQSQYCGGFAGLLHASTISNCYAVGEVNGGVYDTGGFVGGVWQGSTFTNCYAACALTWVVDVGETTVGGFTGEAATGTFGNCVFDLTLSGCPDNNIAANKTTVEMKTQSTFTNWDFTTIWGIDNDYPYLLFMAPAVPYPHLKWEHSMPALIINYMIQQREFPTIDTIQEIKAKVPPTNVSHETEDWDSFKQATTSPASLPLLYENMSFHQIINAVVSADSSAALCKDGRVIFCYQSSTDGVDWQHNIKCGYAADLNTFATATNCITNVTNQFTDASYHLRGTVFNIADELYMGVGKYNPDSVAGHHYVQIYKSPSGNGGDWTLHGTVYDYNAGTRGASTFNDPLATGVPLVLESGRWVMTHFYPYSYNSDWVDLRLAISTSDNNGVTWTKRWEGGSLFYGYYSFVRNIVSFDGNLYATWEGNVYGTRFLQGSADGSSWTTLFSSAAESWYVTRLDLFTDGNYVYKVIKNLGTTTNYVRRTTNPTVVPTEQNPTAGWELVDSYVLDLDAYYMNVGNITFVLGGNMVSNSVNTAPYPHFQWEDTMPALISRKE